MMEKKQISFPRYEHYKDSGIDWIGEIPAHWEIKKLKYLAEINPIHKPRAEFQDQKVIFLPMEKVSEIGKKDYSEFKVYQEVINGYTSFQRYDVLLAKITPCFENGKSAYLDDMPTEYGFGSTEFHVIRAKTATEKYLFYLVTSGYFRKDAEAFMVGSAGQKRVTTEYLKNHKFFIPPPSEQTAIAQFLDHKTAQIDRAIAIKEAQIKLLNERKQIMIQEAVTKGLDPSVPMKDSGIEWIGEIPAHWEVNKLKYQTSLISDRLMANESDLKFIGMENIESWSGKYLPKNEDIAEGLAGYFQKGDLLFGKLRPYLAKVYLATEEGLCSTEFNIYRCEANSSARYYQYLFLSYKFIDLISSSTYGARMPRASSSFIGEQYLPVPAYDEQQQIVTILDEYCNKIAKGIHLFKTQIQTLKEYKTTLINEAVTGKIKIH